MSDGSDTLTVYGDGGTVPECTASTEPPLGMPNDPSVAVSLLSGAPPDERLRSDADTPRAAAASSLSSPTCEERRSASEAGAGQGAGGRAGGARSTAEGSGGGWGVAGARG